MFHTIKTMILYASDMFFITYNPSLNIKMWAENKNFIK